jgi:hypothetical protein
MLSLLSVFTLGNVKNLTNYLVFSWVYMAMVVFGVHSGETFPVLDADLAFIGLAFSVVQLWYIIDGF